MIAGTQSHKLIVRVSEVMKACHPYYDHLVINTCAILFDDLEKGKIPPKCAKTVKYLERYVKAISNKKEAEKELEGALLLGPRRFAQQVGADFILEAISSHTFTDAFVQEVLESLQGQPKQMLFDIAPGDESTFKFGYKDPQGNEITFSTMMAIALTAIRECYTQKMAKEGERPPVVDSRVN